MTRRLVQSFARSPGTLIEDFAGGAALVVLLVTALNLPGLV